MSLLPNPSLSQDAAKIKLSCTYVAVHLFQISDDPWTYSVSFKGDGQRVSPVTFGSSTAFGR